MVDDQCTKRYPKNYPLETWFSVDSYPSYKRRSSQDGSFKTMISRHEVDNTWVVPYSPLLSKTCNVHINVEFCNSVKSIKYVCKYINKESDAAMFSLQKECK